MKIFISRFGIELSSALEKQRGKRKCSALNERKKKRKGNRARVHMAIRWNKRPEASGGSRIVCSSALFGRAAPHYSKFLRSDSSKTNAISNLRDAIYRCLRDKAVQNLLCPRFTSSIASVKWKNVVRVP